MLSYEPEELAVIVSAREWIGMDRLLLPGWRETDKYEFRWGATGLVEMVGDPAIYPDANSEPYYYTGNSNLSGVYEWGNVTISNTNLNNAGAA